MFDGLRNSIETSLNESTGERHKVVDTRTVSGGCINQTWIVRTSSGSAFFVKANSSAHQDIFEIEVDGLRALQQTNTLRVPEVVTWGSVGDTCFLILEAIKSSSRSRDYQQSLGRGLAQLHIASRTSEYGWPIDNFIGETPQPNSRCTSWLKFWRENRLEFQLRLAESNGYGGRLTKLGFRLCEQLDRWIDDSDLASCLLHGDLWSGNHIADQSGNPVLIDPAVYQGHYEAEFGMISLFGGVDGQFYGAYEELLPFDEGHEDRIAIYRLYHLLNHANLFGSSYVNACLEILVRLVA